MTESRTLGDYTIIKQVGQGSLGTVYLAEHRFMKKQCILKVLPEELSTDRGFVQRFEENVGILTTLDHPHIVKIHTVSFAQGQYFLVTDCVVDEYGETTNLAQFMLSRGKRFDDETLFRLMRQVAEALDYAHAKKVNGKGISHRNLKLNNLLVSKGRGCIDLMIADFGLTRIIGSGAVLTRTYKQVAEALGVSSVIHMLGNQDRYPSPSIENQKLTPLHASFMQTYEFLAPEQKKPDLSPTIDGKADVFAFGVLVYNLLTGEFPHGFFPMPKELFSDSSWDWDMVIRECLQPDPAKRPELLVPLLDAVRQHAKGILPKGNKDLPLEHAHSGVSDLNRTNSLQKVSVELLSQQSQNVEHISFTACSINPSSDTKEKELNTLPHSSTAAFAAVSAIESKEKHSHMVVAVESIVKDDRSMAGQSLHQESVTLRAPIEPHVLKPVIKSTQLERPVADLDPGSVFLIDTSVKQYTPEPKEDKNVQPLRTEMIVIPGGLFYRGSKDGNRDEMPRHQVLLSSFAIDIHPVTNEQFVRFLDVMGGEKDNNHQDIIRMRDSRIKRSSGKLSIESGYAKHPVVGVTWYGAIAYAKWIGKRLPREAEWEIAARGGMENSLYFTGEDIEKTQANFFSFDTTAVMSYAPNGLGLYDMAGNVYEWCYDWYGYNYYETSIQEPEDPKGPLQGVYRVLRGGCWKSLKEDLRSSRRHRNNPGTVNGTYGFRCAADVQ